MPIIICPYNPSWPVEFEELAAILRTALGNLAVSVDHIGSTSVPRLDAKDIIDIQITISEWDEKIVGAMASIGSIKRNDITGDHVPPDADGPESDWKKWYFQPPQDWRPSHLHMRMLGRPNQKYPLLFRDYLRAHPEAAEAYARIKRALARLHPDDATAFYDVKDPVCDLIWQAACAWEKQQG